MAGFNDSAGTCGIFRHPAAGECSRHGSRAPLLDVSRTSISFGRDAENVEFVQPLFLTNVGDGPSRCPDLRSPVKMRPITASGGPADAPTIFPGGRCRLDVIGALSITEFGDAHHPFHSAAGSVAVSLSGTPSPDIVRGVFATPPWIDFDRQPLGTTSAPQTLTITDPERIAFIFESVEISGKHAADFSMTSDCVVGRPYVNNGGCSATIAFSPVATGRARRNHVPRSPSTPPALGFVTLSYSLTGVGGAVTPVDVVEYYNPRSTTTSSPGSPPRRPIWMRARRRPVVAYGLFVSRDAQPQTGTSPVCRYYLPPAFGDSHFFGEEVPSARRRAMRTRRSCSRTRSSCR